MDLLTNGYPDSNRLIENIRTQMAVLKDRYAYYTTSGQSNGMRLATETRLAREALKRELYMLLYGALDAPPRDWEESAE